MKAADVMTRDVVTTTPDARLDDVGRTMIRQRIGGVPVVDTSGTVVGIITEGDLMRRAETGTEKRHSPLLALLLTPGRSADKYVRSYGRTVGEVMSPSVVSVAPETSLAEIVALMESRQIKRVPVLENGRLVGIVSRADLLRALVEMLPTVAAAAVSDALIRSHILAEIERQCWAPHTIVDVIVEDGTAELRGIITDKCERRALYVLAENTLGVKGVRDRLAWLEPISGRIIDLPPADG